MSSPENKISRTELASSTILNLIKNAKGVVITEPELFNELTKIGNSLGIEYDMNTVAEITIQLKNQGFVEKSGTNGWKIK